ncbi:hypothetical protein DPMN_150698 [Dreissena polymorpha]|uniref:Uncharacterized protein n=1 Tax=Dreissena polymorpha TaxID=45954 RepID=A0A9D4FDW7_DREPO|nr:hypothetical protein DPMN_150698 [Dreissena polymorpha]
MSRSVGGPSWSEYQEPEASSFKSELCDSLSKSISSLTHLETLIIVVDDDSHCLCKDLHGLNIKSLSLRGDFGLLNHVESLSQTLSSLQHLEELSIVNDDTLNHGWFSTVWKSRA